MKYNFDEMIDFSKRYVCIGYSLREKLIDLLCDETCPNIDLKDITELEKEFKDYPEVVNACETWLLENK